MKHTIIQFESDKEEEEKKKKRNKNRKIMWIIWFMLMS